MATWGGSEKTLFLGANCRTRVALVSTGDNLKEWTYYAKSENDFLRRLNAALGHKKPFPIEVHAGPDSQWSTYTKFISGVKQ
jgi:hypothetical protein